MAQNPFLTSSPLPIKYLHPRIGPDGVSASGAQGRAVVPIAGRRVYVGNDRHPCRSAQGGVQCLSSHAECWL